MTSTHHLHQVLYRALRHGLLCGSSRGFRLGEPLHRAGRGAERLGGDGSAVLVGFGEEARAGQVFMGFFGDFVVIFVIFWRFLGIGWGFHPMN